LLLFFKKEGLSFSLMSLLKIARMGHPVLLQRAEKVPDPTAPDISLFVLHLPAERSGAEPVAPFAVINPELELLGEETVLRWEGCLSIPGLRAAVPRHVRVRYSGVDTDGAPVGGEVDGLHANVVQHEYDHLDGILYPMRVTDFRQFGFIEEMAKYPPQPEERS